MLKLSLSAKIAVHWKICVFLQGMEKEYRKYRLRIQNRIVGYAEETKNGMLFRGKEPLWWMRGKPNYDEVDEAIGLKDRLNREIYEMDIVSYKINDSLNQRSGVVLWEERKEIFGVFDIKSRHFTHFFMEGFCLFNEDKLEIISHLFNHPKLEEELGLKGI